MCGRMRREFPGTPDHDPARPTQPASRLEPRHHPPGSAASSGTRRNRRRQAGQPEKRTPRRTGPSKAIRESRVLAASTFKLAPTAWRTTGTSTATSVPPSPWAVTTIFLVLSTDVRTYTSSSSSFSNVPAGIRGLILPALMNFSSARMSTHPPSHRCTRT